MLRIAVVDDDERDRDHMASLVDRYFEGDALSYQLTCLEDGEDLLEGYRPCYDLVFLDIEMERLDGMACARRLRQVDREVALVFTTNLAQYAASGYDVDALGYLVKPVRYYNFALAMRRVEEALARRHDLTLWLPRGEDRVAVSTRDLLYVEVRKHSLLYHVVRARGEGEVLETRGTLHECADQLAPYGFCRCNRYCLVSLAHVRALREDGLELDDGEVLEVSRRTKRALMDSLNEYFGTR